ncbi:MAG: nicotinate-nucleotide--dimethylbenzimidazole phosphoribosyltransferase [Desulfocucumaceae bacterium]
MNSELYKVISDIKPVSREWRRKAIDYLNQLAIPRGSLGELLVLAEQLSGIKETLKPSVKRKVVVTMAGDHGVVREGVSAFPQDVTPQMVNNFVLGGAAINVLAEVAGARVVVVDMGVAADLGTLVKKGKIVSWVRLITRCPWWLTGLFPLPERCWRKLWRPTPLSI